MPLFQRRLQLFLFFFPELWIRLSTLFKVQPFLSDHSTGNRFLYSLCRNRSSRRSMIPLSSLVRMTLPAAWRTLFIPDSGKHSQIHFLLFLHNRSAKFLSHFQSEESQFPPIIAPISFSPMRSIPSEKIPPIMQNATKDSSFFSNSSRNSSLFPAHSWRLSVLYTESSLQKILPDRFHKPLPTFYRDGKDHVISFFSAIWFWQCILQFCDIPRNPSGYIKYSHPVR